MDIDYPIPSNLYIKQTQSYIYLQHDNQIQTCNKCGYDGHVFRRCETNVQDRINIVDLNDLGKDDDDNDEEDVESNVDDNNDTNSDGINTAVEETEGSLDEQDDLQEQFACAECVYKGNDQKTFEDHMETHNPVVEAQMHLEI